MKDDKIPTVEDECWNDYSLEEKQEENDSHVNVKSSVMIDEERDFFSSQIIFPPLLKANN